MKTFIAKNPKQLDLCLKLMYTENLDFTVAVTQPSKHKIIYEIYASVNGNEGELLERKYNVLIS